MRVALIGDNIDASQAPRLHHAAAALTGVTLRYERLVPPRLQQDLRTVFEGARASGYRGLNVTYPYKERVLEHLDACTRAVSELGAANTVLFDAGGAHGANTDHSGFVNAYRQARPGSPPGAVALLGAGGVGRAIAFALVALGARRLALFDIATRNARALAAALAQHHPGTLDVVLAGSAREAAAGADGIVNCSPVGMLGMPGTPVEASALAGASWVFDAVYTPLHTRFLRDAGAAGIATISGYELFIHQGLHAFELFTGTAVDEAALRAALAE